MKGFNLELALKGHPVITSNGKYPARIVCTDVKGEFPLLVLLENTEYDEEWPERYTLDGKSRISTDRELVMADTSVKISDEITQALVTLGYHYVAINSEGLVAAFTEKPVMQYLPTERVPTERDENRWMYGNPPSCSPSVRPMEITHLTGNIKYVTVEDSLIDLL